MQRQARPSLDGVGTNKSVWGRHHLARRLSICEAGATSPCEAGEIPSVYLRSDPACMRDGRRVSIYRRSGLDTVGSRRSSSRLSSTIELIYSPREASVLARIACLRNGNTDLDYEQCVCAVCREQQLLLSAIDSELHAYAI